MRGQYAWLASSVGEKRACGHPARQRTNPERDVKRACRQSTALEAPRRATTAQLPHEQAEIEGARVDQEAFEDVALSPQVRAAHPAGVVDMRERPLQVLPAATQQPLPPRRADAPAIAVDGPLGVRGRRPLTAAPRWLRDIRPDAEGAQIEHRLIAVIAL